MIGAGVADMMAEADSCPKIGATGPESGAIHSTYHE